MPLLKLRCLPVPFRSLCMKLGFAPVGLRCSGRTCLSCQSERFLGLLARLRLACQR
jgi:hypothetical protein